MLHHAMAFTRWMMYEIVSAPRTPPNERNTNCKHFYFVQSTNASRGQNPSIMQLGCCAHELKLIAIE